MLMVDPSPDLVFAPLLVADLEILALIFKPFLVLLPI
jgi:hypothetical protein